MTSVKVVKPCGHFFLNVDSDEWSQECSGLWKYVITRWFIFCAYVVLWFPDKFALRSHSHLRVRIQPSSTPLETWLPSPSRRACIIDICKAKTTQSHACKAGTCVYTWLSGIPCSFLLALLQSTCLQGNLEDILPPPYRLFDSIPVSEIRFVCSSNIELLPILFYFINKTSYRWKITVSHLTI